jgi:hypothetical protein
MLDGPCAVCAAANAGYCIPAGCLLCLECLLDYLDRIKEVPLGEEDQPR